ncbi:MAG: apolipoprotein N-acyltransferase [Polyangiaceae bacterium]
MPLKYAIPGAALSGVLCWLAFAGCDIWPLTFIALAPLIIVIRRQTPKRAAWLGLLAGTVMNALGFYWLLTMLKVFGGFPWALCALFALIVCAYQGGRYAMAAWLTARGIARGWHGHLVFGFAFVCAELLYPVLFPWYFGASMHKVPLFLQTADIGGPIMVTLVMMGSNIAVAELVLAKLEGRSLDRRALLAGLGLPVVGAIYGAIRIHQVDALAAASTPVHAGLVQGNLGLMQKRDDPSEALRRHKRMTADLRKKGVEFVVWSESSVTFMVPESSMKSFMRDRIGTSMGIPAIFGGVLYRVDEDRERWFNTAIATDARGEVQGRYDKHFLLMFGEYLPLGDTFPILYKWSPNSGKFSAGTDIDPLPIETRGETHPVTTLICYEDILPGFTNDAVRRGNPELIVNITNDAWFGDSSEPWEHLGLAKLRTVEHHRYMVRATNSGVSAIVDPVGRTIAQTHTFQQETANAVVKYMRMTTIYELIGDKLWYVAALVSIYFAYFTKKKKKSAVGEVGARII